MEFGNESFLSDSLRRGIPIPGSENRVAVDVETSGTAIATAPLHNLRQEFLVSGLDQLGIENYVPPR